MARTSTYLNFRRETEAAFEFYRSIFGGEFIGGATPGGIMRFGDMPPNPDGTSMNPADAALVMHIELEITGGHVIMGTDAPESLGMSVTQGDNVSLNLEPDTLEEGQRLFDALSQGGTVTMALQPMFWGAHWGSLVDKFGMHWMVNVAAAQD